jgi:holo-[acyl-carrier protein] synthase
MQAAWRTGAVILGLGIDVVPTSRVARELARGSWREGDGIFTPAEIAYCSSRKNPAPSYAACFAAKEATLKALGASVVDLGIFREVETRFETPVRPQVVLYGGVRRMARRLEAHNILLSLAIARNCVGAMVLLER